MHQARIRRAPCQHSRTSTRSHHLHLQKAPPHTSFSHLHARVLNLCGDGSSRRTLFLESINSTANTKVEFLRCHHGLSQTHPLQESDTCFGKSAQSRGRVDRLRTKKQRIHLLGRGCQVQECVRRRPGSGDEAQRQRASRERLEESAGELRSDVEVTMAFLGVVKRVG